MENSRDSTVKEKWEIGQMAGRTEPLLASLSLSCLSLHINSTKEDKHAHVAVMMESRQGLVES